MKRRISTWTTTSTQSVQQKKPEAFITKGKQRIKQHDGIVYLKDKQEFEIELFNPTKIHQLAKIKLNGNYIQGGGIILRPGERVFLERYLDSNNKFVFSTYEVGKTKEVQEAIKNNGDVEIEYYEELFQTLTTTINTPWQNPYWYETTNPYPYNGNFYSSSGTTTNVHTTTTSNSNISATSNFMPTSLKGASKPRKQETGMVDKGSKSDQQFTTMDKQFLSVSSWNVMWKILPQSQQLYTSNTISKVYCTECGSRIKKSTFKFCPNCGTAVN